MVEAGAFLEGERVEGSVGGAGVGLGGVDGLFGALCVSRGFSGHLRCTG